MLSLASLALVVALVLAASAYAVVRFDALDRRVALVVVAAALVTGGVAAQVAPSDSPADVERTVSAASDEATPERLAAEQAEAPTASHEVSNGTNATVVGVGDGGRVTYRMDGETRTVRLAGVDVPSAGGADPALFDGVVTGSRGRACLAREGRRALLDTRAQLVDESVSVRTGEDGAVLVADGRSVNRRLVERGNARATTRTYADAERSARSAHIGVWSCSVVEPSRPLREANASNVRIDAIHPNPPGDDAASLNDEYVVIENAGSRTVDLSDWYLIVGDDEMHFFFDGQTLRPGEEIVLRMGSGRNTEGTVYWGASSPVLDNDHETLKLVDGDTDRTVRVSY
ncbi:Lamin Tail Domain [Haloplanus vescus]|uniref:Lamin Tail Domain n=1 Tax=Haloplanus vescus TaxID=555874 RepID=A0A1H3Y7H9_9EURY|nr:lamin tail domain-containing protein [Haloplanus vescus]SEA07021.1 Lamin Tail Domain [Haloplanus vescus]